MASSAAPASDRVRERDAPGTVSRELLAVVFALALLALLMCSGHIARGGSYFDDWSLLELTRFSPPGGLLHGLWLDYGQRPGQVLYYAALSEAFGSSVSSRLALAAAAVTLEASCLYALLRYVGLRAWECLAIAALTLLFPFSDSVWLWDVVSLASLSVAAGLVGVILALRALRSSGSGRLLLHSASLALYLASVLSYEVFAVAGCLAGLLYVRAVGWRAARLRWMIDVLLIATAMVLARGVLPVDVATPSNTQPLSGMIEHAGLLAGDGARLAGAAILPIGGISPWIGTALLVSVLVAAVIARALPTTDVQTRRELDRLLWLAGAGILVALAAWTVYLPGPDHYSPIAPGTVNRMNVLAAIGIVMLLYSSVALAATMLTAAIGRAVTSPSVLASPNVLLACVAAPVLALGGVYLERTASDARAWDRAASDQRALLSALHEVLPYPGPMATVYVVGAPQTVGPNVPVLDTALDLTGAMRISYATNALFGIPLADPATLECGRKGPVASGHTGTYGDSYLVDLTTRRAVPLVNRRRCAGAGGAVSLSSPRLALAVRGDVQM